MRYDRIARLLFNWNVANEKLYEQENRKKKIMKNIKLTKDTREKNLIKSTDCAATQVMYIANFIHSARVQINGENIFR